MSAIKGNRRIILKNPLDPTTWSAVETLRNASIQLDADGNVIAIPTFSINPQVNPISAGGSIGNVSIKDGSSSLLANVTSPGVSQVTMGAQNLLNTFTIPYGLTKSTGLYDQQEYPDAFSSVLAGSTGTTTILAAGGASKKYKLFSLTIEGASSGAVLNPAAVVQETTSGVQIGALSLNGAQANSATINFGPNGVLQPTANNAIELVNLANVLSSATLVYGAAR